MAVRLLTPKEQKVLESFSHLKPVYVDASQVSFGADSDLYTLVDPIIYLIPGTSHYLVFGEIKKAMSLNQMKSW
jgi:hypothetical protein